MAKELLKLFSVSSFGGGGSFFTDGLYKIEEAQFVYYDFNGTAQGKNGKGIASLSLNLQPLDKNGEPAGEPVMQYWGLGDDAVVEAKGKSISLSGNYSTVWKLCDYAIFIEHLGKSGFDRDALEEADDISVLDGLVAEFGKVASPRTGGTPKKDKEGKELPPRQIVVITAVPDAKSDNKKGGSKAADKKGGSSKKDNSAEAEEMLLKYLVEKVLLEKNEAKGVASITARMGIGKFVLDNDGDAALTKATVELFGKKDVLGAALESAGWELDGATIKKS